eukprot:CAMPEP_0119346424 /NCGR_PEP_ID=MMETSP1333-20130426/107996_1 /TAXON_ID=418940 /ORGANISM="Scyphosphaera apsteinii, Strain RCC1455" /LENGTH=355 /DNA_ID=CAMNT_0007358925 /DNA_START=16 /DNA_END=1083 /DNA_ORIENTATION=-
MAEGISLSEDLRFYRRGFPIQELEIVAQRDEKLGIIGLDIDDNNVAGIVPECSAARAGNLLVGDRIVGCDDVVLAPQQQVNMVMVTGRAAYTFRIHRKTGAESSDICAATTWADFSREWAIATGHATERSGSEVAAVRTTTWTNFSCQWAICTRQVSGSNMAAAFECLSSPQPGKSSSAPDRQLPNTPATPATPVTPAEALSPDATSSTHTTPSPDAIASANLPAPNAAHGSATNAAHGSATNAAHGTIITCDNERSLLDGGPITAPSRRRSSRQWSISHQLGQARPRAMTYVFSKAKEIDDEQAKRNSIDKDELQVAAFHKGGKFMSSSRYSADEISGHDASLTMRRTRHSRAK